MRGLRVALALCVLAAAGTPPQQPPARIIWGNATPSVTQTCPFALRLPLDNLVTTAEAKLSPRDGNGSDTMGFFVAVLTSGAAQAVVRGSGTVQTMLDAAERHAVLLGAAWRPAAVGIRRLYGWAATDCDLKKPSSWHGARAALSFGEWQRLFPCTIADDLGGVPELTVNVKWLSTSPALKRAPCRFDGHDMLGTEVGVARSVSQRGLNSRDRLPFDKQPLFVPTTCALPSPAALRARLRRRRLLVIGDSVSERFHDALKSLAPGTTYLSLNQNVGQPVNEGIGVGLGWFFAETPPFAATSLEPGDLQLHPQNWPAFLEALRKADIAIMNSGLHDVAPMHQCEGIARNPATGSTCNASATWHGDKAALVAHYATRTAALFAALKSHNVTHKILWRTTTYPGFLYTQYLLRIKPMRGSKWYYRCDTQHLRLDLVDTINAAVLRAAKFYGIAVWDVSLMASAMKAEHFNDIVHPTVDYATTWALVLATFDGFDDPPAQPTTAAPDELPLSPAYAPHIAALRRPGWRRLRLPNVTRQVHAANSSVAVLFTGYPRTETRAQLEKHITYALGCDVFIVTYRECQKTAEHLAGKRVHTITDVEKQTFEVFVAAYASKGHFRGIWQWFQLKLAFGAFDFEPYATLVKSRVDAVMPPPSVFSYAALRAKADAVHCYSDKVFFSTPETMRLLWEDFINVGIEVYAQRQPEAVERQLMRHFNTKLLPLVRPPNRDDTLGCKVPRREARQPWDLGRWTAGFFSEWAFTYHIVSHELKCLPLSLPRKSVGGILHGRHASPCQLDNWYAENPTHTLNSSKPPRWGTGENPRLPQNGRRTQA